MSEEDLIKAYTEGAISRRAFVRRLIAGGLSLSAALAYGVALDPTAAAATTVTGGSFHGHKHHHKHKHKFTAEADAQDVQLFIRRLLR